VIFTDTTGYYSVTPNTVPIPKGTVIDVIQEINAQSDPTVVTIGIYSAPPAENVTATTTQVTGKTKTDTQNKFDVIAYSQATGTKLGEVTVNSGANFAIKYSDGPISTSDAVSVFVSYENDETYSLVSIAPVS